MKILAGYTFTLFLLFSPFSLAQVDIYQSDAYSVEEMCARQAEQDTGQVYSEAYDSCIEQNRDNPMYQEDEKEKDEVG